MKKGLVIFSGEYLFKQMFTKIVQIAMFDCQYKSATRAKNRKNV